MKTLETDVEISADGSLKLLSPLPSWLRPGRSHVLLVLSDSESTSTEPKSQACTPGIEQADDVCGGDACIAKTRVPVWTLEQSRRQGFTEVEILEAYPSLRQSDLATAWAYVATHQEEIENAISQNELA